MRIVQVVPFPLDNQTFGGAIRALKIREKLESLGHEVTTITAFLGEGGITKLGPTLEVPTLWQKEALGNSTVSLTPYVCFDTYFCSEEGRKRIRSAISGRRYDALLFEHPFLVRAFLTEVESQNPREFPKIIYSSHNIESSMLGSIFHDAEIKVDDEVAHHWVTEMLEQEKFAATRSDLVLAVTDEDKVALENLGAELVFTVPNGSHLPLPSPEALGEVAGRLGKRKFFLFISSAHPPNISGFESMLGDDGTFLPPDWAIVVAGTASHPILSSIERKELESLSSRIVLFGEVTEDVRAALIQLSSAVILPITSGGGSNLKTAEAILSDKPIVATTVALRGFESYADSPGIHIAESADQFRSIMSSIAVGTSPEGMRVPNRDQEPTWENSLRKLEILFPKSEEKHSYLITLLLKRKKLHLHQLKSFLYWVGK